jgi:Tfp pilus assembly protein PilF
MGRRTTAMVLLMLVGCAPLGQERVRDLNADGQLLFGQGNYAAARESFRQSLALRPTDAALIYNIGQCSERLGELELAENSYREVLQKVPGHAPSRHALVAVLVKRERAGEARRLVDDWLAQNPNSAAARSADGWLLLQTGDTLRARTRFQEALTLDPRDVKALTELGLIYETMGRPDRAAALYERALEQDPRQADVAERVKKMKAEGVSLPRPD